MDNVHVVNKDGNSLFDCTFQKGRYNCDRTTEPTAVQNVVEILETLHRSLKDPVAPVELPPAPPATPTPATPTPTPATPTPATPTPAQPEINITFNNSVRPVKKHLALDELLNVNEKQVNKDDNNPLANFIISSGEIQSDTQTVQKNAEYRTISVDFAKPDELISKITYELPNNFRKIGGRKMRPLFSKEMGTRRTKQEKIQTIQRWQEYIPLGDEEFSRYLSIEMAGLSANILLLKNEMPKRYNELILKSDSTDQDEIYEFSIGDSTQNMKLPADQVVETDKLDAHLQRVLEIILNIKLYEYISLYK